MVLIIFHCSRFLKDFIILLNWLGFFDKLRDFGKKLLEKVI